MDHYQGQHGHADNRVDEYGNPVAGGHGATATGGMGGGHGGIAPGAFTGTGTGGQFQPSREQHKPGGVLRRSGSSSSSSSSEDDGMGGRRKKGMKEKIKEKLPGGRKDDNQQQHMGAISGSAYGQQGHAGTGAHGVGAIGEKKGVMDKIKEKLPGQH